MKRMIAVALIAVTIFQLWTSAPSRIDAATTTPNITATLETYQTEVARLNGKVDKLETSVAKRDAKLDDFRTKIAQLNGTVTNLQSLVPTATPDAEVFSLRGNGEQVSKVFTVPSSGVYLLTAENFNPRFLAVDLYTSAGDWNPGFSISTLDSGTFTSAGYLDAGQYYLQIKANAGWSVKIEAQS